MALRSLRFEKSEKERKTERERERKDWRLTEYAIFTVSDRFLLRQSIDMLLVNVELLF